MTQNFPKYETYGLSSQIQRAAVSIPSNIAEGWARDSTQEFLRFITIARDIHPPLTLTGQAGASQDLAI